jgi:hypothetical protein
LQISTLRSDLETSQAAEAESLLKITELECVLYKLQAESESHANVVTEEITSEDVDKLSAELVQIQKEKVEICFISCW